MSNHLYLWILHNLLSWRCSFGCKLQHNFGKTAHDKVYILNLESLVSGSTLWSELWLSQWNTKSFSATLITSVRTEVRSKPNSYLKVYSCVRLIEREWHYFFCSLSLAQGFEACFLAVMFWQQEKEGWPSDWWGSSLSWAVWLMGLKCFASGWANTFDAIQTCSRCAGS